MAPASRIPQPVAQKQQYKLRSDAKSLVGGEVDRARGNINPTLSDSMMVHFQQQAHQDADLQLEN